VKLELVDAQGCPRTAQLHGGKTTRRNGSIDALARDAQALGRLEARAALTVVLEACFPDGGDKEGEGVFALVLSQAGAHAAELVGKSSGRETFGGVDVEERECAIQHRVAFAANNRTVCFDNQRRAGRFAQRSSRRLENLVE
jgi:hypothetical protein